MTEAHDSKVEAMKEAAVLRSLADQVASPVVAGRKSRRALTSKQRSQWEHVVSRVTGPTLYRFNQTCWPLTADDVAVTWKSSCKAVGIGTGIFGWFLWNWAFPLLIELAKLWIESRNQGRISDR